MKDYNKPTLAWRAVITIHFRQTPPPSPPPLTSERVEQPVTRSWYVLQERKIIGVTLRIGRYVKGSAGLIDDLLFPAEGSLGETSTVRTLEAG